MVDMPEPGTKFSNRPMYALQSEVRQTSAGKPYVNVTLRTPLGNVFEDSKVFGPRRGMGYDHALSGCVIVSGEVQEYNGSIQILVEDWMVDEDGLPEDYQPKAPWDLTREHVEDRIEALFDRIDTDNIRKFVEGYIKHCCQWDSLGNARNIDMYTFPGAAMIHHAYIHGLAEHVSEVAEIALQVSERFSPLYISGYEKDLLVAGCLIHDMGKLDEIQIVDGVSYEKSRLHQSYGWSSSAHLFIGSQLLARYHMLNRGLLLESEYLVLQNIVLSHHGYGDWSPVKPAYTIAAIAHHADYVSSQVNRMLLQLHRVNGGDVVRDKTRQSYMPVVKPAKGETP